MKSRLDSNFLSLSMSSYFYVVQGSWKYRVNVQIWMIKILQHSFKIYMEKIVDWNSSSTFCFTLTLLQNIVAFPICPIIVVTIGWTTGSVHFSCNPSQSYTSISATTIIYQTCGSKKYLMVQRASMCNSYLKPQQ